jgi:predicted nucleotidyltransferase component of viral defense system
VAGEVRLFEHPEFEQIILRAAQRFGLNEQFIEKDYYVTETLRIVANQLGEQAIFKGGTSLSKGWHLIERFSEDIDLFVNPRSFTKPPGKNKMDKILKDLAQTVAAHPALAWSQQESTTIGGLGRQDHFLYETRFPELPGIRSAVRLEPGVQSGDFPTETIQIESLLAGWLREQDRADIADDIEPFEMTLMHYRRTFVEKMFALHGKVIRLQTEDHPLARDARHYCDLYALAAEPAVRAMLESEEYEQIRHDYDRISRTFVPRIEPVPTAPPRRVAHDRLASSPPRPCRAFMPPPKIVSTCRCLRP